MSGSLGHLFQGKTDAEIRENSDKVIKLIQKGDISFKNLSLRDLGESCLGSEGMAAFGRGSEEGGFAHLEEAVEGIVSTNFTNITGTLVYQNVVEQYNAPQFIGDQLFTAETSREDNTREIGIADIDDDALVVPEATEYPEVKFGEDYIDIPKSLKRGMKIAVTREMVFFDKTGQVVKKAQAVGLRLGTNKEKRQLRVAFGITNPFSRNGTARNTYVAAGGTEKRANLLVTNPLTDWTSIDLANQLFVAMTDDRTVGEPISVMPDTIIASAARNMQINQILTASGVNKNAVTAAATPYPLVQTLGSNPVQGKFTVLYSQWLDWLLVNEASISASNARQYWYIGQPKKCFVYRTLFPLSVRAAPVNDVDDFDRDIVMKFRADERGVAYVHAPWYMVENSPT